jgi:hypothetical protein
VHVSFLSAFYVLTFILSNNYPLSYQSPLEYAISIIPIALLFLGYALIVRRLESIQDPLSAIALILPVVFLVTQSIAIVAWSERVPSRVIRSAEVLAAVRPYCIEVADRGAASNRRDLTGLKMQYPRMGSMSLGFNALMVIKSDQKLAFANWSYRLDRFDPVRGDARVALHLDEQGHCAPSPNFAANLK